MKRRWWILATGSGAVAVMLGGPPLLRRVSFFKVRQVQVVGARYLTGAEVTSALELPPDASLFDRLEGLEERVARIPGVRRAEVGRRWPVTLVVWVSEAEPVALTPQGGRLALMDETGTVLPFDPTRAPADLPVAQADRELGGLLARVREAEPRLFAEVETARRVRGDVALHAGERRLLLRGDASADAIRALGAVVRDLARRGRAYQELDARFTDRVFVRGMTL